MTGRCRLCAEDNVLRPRLTLDGSRALGKPFTLSRCQACGAWQVDPPLNLEYIHEYFAAPERWQTARDPDGRAVDPLERAAARQGEYEKYAAALVEYMRPMDKVLDVGAGAGLMLSLLPETLLKIAVEPNPAAADLAAGRGLAVRRQWAEELEFPLESLDCLIMNQTFDHLRDPAGFLNAAAEWLKPGGQVLLTGLINPNGLIPRLYGHRFRLWHPLYQIYPPPEAMGLVLSGYGFQVIRLWQPYWDTPYGGLKQFLRDTPNVLANILSFGQNKISPAWPGNTYSILARKTFLLQPLKKPARKWYQALLSRPRAAPGAAASCEAATKPSGFDGKCL